MKVVQVFEVGIVLEGDDQSEPETVREVIGLALEEKFEKLKQETGVNWPVAHTVTFKNEFLRRKDR
jgi:hypothetical protein